ncbi:alpha/beta hydrolase [Tropicimonas marinistellae]|uniref:alpha/beta hydrolase n=1 Tax=Tropicimonas marinistellae TaxID=1739787 RepID=UPI0008302611|nr:alpha/beta hydrolase [Tropicimonas marinistellae]
MHCDPLRKLASTLGLLLFLTTSTGVARVAESDSGWPRVVNPADEFDWQSPPLWSHVPDTVSRPWHAVITGRGQRRTQENLPGPDALEAWAELQRANDAAKEPRADEIATALNVTYQQTEIGGLPVLDITPMRPVHDDKVAVYVHGGSYVANSAKAIIAPAAVFAAGSGMRVLSIDYTLAPHSKWDETTDEVISVFAALAEAGIPPRNIVLFGDSAGGGLAAGSTLKMRDLGMELPAALVLWSPWADVTDSGDTYVTLAAADPSFTYDSVLRPAALAYANPKDHRNPYVSPVYGDFSKGFPPTLIQGGTREIMLSDMVRLYQALDSNDQVAKLDIYEGMPHNFIPAVPGSDESQAAMKKVSAWVEAYLLDD